MKLKINKVPAGGMFMVEDISLDQIFTPEDFSSEHRDISAAADEFITGEIASRGAEIETLSNSLSRELMRKAGELGFLGIDLPEKFGGMALDKISSALVSERFGYGAGSFTITELNHTGIGTLPVALFGTEQQKRKYLPRLSCGELIGAFGLTEPEAGSDALNPLTTASLSEGGKYFVLNGSKQFITNAGFADIIFVYAKVDGRLFTAFIVEQQWPGVSVDEEEEKMGMHGTSTRAYHFDNVKVPVENVLGEVGRGHVVAFNALNMGRYKVGSVCVGSAKRAFEEAVRYSKQRKQFGNPICEFGMIKEKIARMATRIFAAESMMYRTAGLLESMLTGLDMDSDEAGSRVARALEECLIECSINKVYGSETEDYVVDEEVQIHGGYGYIRGSHPELAYRNARINRIWEGTNEINRLVIGSTLLRKLENCCDFQGAFDCCSRAIQDLRFPNVDVASSLIPERLLLGAGKKVFLLVLAACFQRYGKELRREQEIMRAMSDIVIDIYAVESALLRTEKIEQKKELGKVEVPKKMVKLLCHESIERIGLHAREVLGSLGGKGFFRKQWELVRDLMTAPQMDVVKMRRDVAEAFILTGRYFLSV
jgi:alkylation response protein AidB-like acyl-CoA dehydrogenase